MIVDPYFATFLLSSLSLNLDRILSIPKIKIGGPVLYVTDPVRYILMEQQ